jgi:outer membrane protein assembly factor BamB
MRFHVSLVPLLAVAALANAAPAPKAADAPPADWPQWLGPTRDGFVPEKIAPWSGDLKVLWHVSVGEANSSPVVANGLVYLHSKVKDKDVERVQAFDAKTGNVKWTQDYDKTPFKPLFGEGPRATPCVHDGMVYTLGNTGVLACWEAATGKPVWKVDTLADPKKENLFFGVSASPLIAGDNVVVQGGLAGSRGLKAYNRKTGKLAWTAGDDPPSYAAPILVGKDIVVLTGANLMAVSLSGEVRWRFPFKDQLSESSTTPIRVGELYIAASVTIGAAAVRVVDQEGKPVPDQAWKNPTLTCYFSTPVPAGKDHLYFVTGMASLTNPSVTLRCVETATGKEVWKRPNIGKYHAALLRTADDKLLMHDDGGDLHLLAPNAKEYEELAKSKASGPTWAHPAVAGGKIYLRDAKELICLSLTGE